MPNELAKLPTMLAVPQVARLQSKYGRDPTDQLRMIVASEQNTNRLGHEGNQAQRATLDREPAEHA